MMSSHSQFLISSLPTTNKKFPFGRFLTLAKLVALAMDNAGGTVVEMVIVMVAVTEFVVIVMQGGFDLNQVIT